MRKPFRVALAAASLAAGSPAAAAWQQASSKHFVIYADSNPDRLRDFAVRLEKYDQAVRAVMHYEDPPVGDGNRLTVYVLPSVEAVQKLAGNKFVAGFYLPRATGSVAFVPRSIGGDWEGDMNQDTVFFHEYAHHLMMEDLNAIYPEWLVEGFAEFMETATIEKDGAVVLGTPPAFRAWGLTTGQSIPLQDLLAGRYDSSKMPDSQREASLYGLAWLLTHYLYMDPSRSGQISKYLELLSSGATPMAAAQGAFADIARLDHDLKAYKEQHSMLAMRIPASKTQPGNIDVKPLSDGGSAVVLLRADLTRNLDDGNGKQLADKIGAVQQQYRGDEMVEATAAEADLRAGRVAEAEAAADRVLVTNPKSTEGLLLKGRAIEERAKDAVGQTRSDLFDEARARFGAANKIDTEDPEPLYEFYRSYALQGIRPSADAINAMHYASDLAPQDFGLRMNSALAYLSEGKPQDARSALAVVAYSPHADNLAEIARNMIARIDVGDVKGALAAAQSGSSKGANAQ